MSDKYTEQNIYRYCRKTYKERKEPKKHEGPSSPRVDTSNGEIAESPRSERDWCSPNRDDAGCSCDVDPELQITGILHKKCPVITLAQYQLQKLLDGTDRLRCENNRCCRSVYDIFCLCKDLLASRDKGQCAMLFLTVGAFLVGVLLGAASCGSLHGRFDSPILSCIDNYFITDSYPTIKESFRSIF